MKLIIIKKNTIRFIMAIFIVLIILAYWIVKSQIALPTSFLPISNKIIAIDPGHGGVDPGAVSKNGVKEDELNLKIALKLKRLIEQSGGIVFMTRTSDVGLYSKEAKTLRQMKTEDLTKRREIIDDSGSHILISIHLNSFTRASYSGAQTFYKKDSLEGEELANIIQEQLKNILDNNNKRQPQKRDDVYILNEVSMPAVLVECGFLSNVEEEKLLIDETHQEKIAWAIYIGIMNYFN